MTSIIKINILSSASGIFSVDSTVCVSNIDGTEQPSNCMVSFPYQ